MKSTSRMFKALFGGVILLLGFALVGHVEAAGTWTATGPMPSVRSGHTGILLPNDQVLVAGGSAPDLVAGTPWSSTAALYDPISNTWSPTASMSTVRAGFTLTLLGNGKVLAAGGANQSSGTLATAELYDYTTGLWTATGSMPNVHVGHTATLLPNGKVLIVSGLNVLPGCCYFPMINGVDIYDPVSGTWSTTGPVADGRAGHIAALLANGKVLVAGGGNLSGNLTSAEIYDPATGTWSFTSSMLGSGTGSGTLLPNGDVMAAGGLSYPMTASVELYHPISGTWSFTGSMGVSRTGHTATLMADGKVLVAGGYAAGFVISPTAERYDSALGTWSPTVSMSTGRNSTIATLLSDGRVLVSGGHDGSSDLASAEIFSPYDQPQNKDECRKNGWQGLTRADGTPFKNQGDCSQYVNPGK